MRFRKLTSLLNLAIAGALLTGIAAVGCSKESQTSASSDKPPVIIISIDTLRADHLPTYGYQGVSTPNIDALARESVVFDNAWSHVPLTLPSHVSILTGELPTQNGVRNNLGYHYDVAAHPSITSVLKKAGYESGAAVSAYVLHGSTGIADAFDYYEDAIGLESGIAVGRLQRPGSRTVAVADEWLQPRANKPLFFLLHLFEPHAPYEPPEPFRSRYAANLYDGEVAASDDLVGTFIAFLKQQGIYDRALIILLSDHGEGLGDHGEQEHGIFLYREVLHVPLMIKLPGGKRGGERIGAPVQLIDVAPTIASVVGTAPDKRWTGTSLVDSAVGQTGRTIYSETLYPRLHLGWSELRSLLDKQYQLISSPKPELFDYIADPRETRNVLNDQRRVYATMRKQLDAFGKTIVAPSNINPEEAAKLAALGYIGSTQATGNDLPDPKDHIGEIELVKKATRLSAQGKSAEAVAAYRSVLATNPGFHDVWSLLATELEHMGRFDDAVAAYKEGMRRTPDMATEMAISLGYLLVRTKRIDEAEQHARLALDKNPAGAHLLLARIALTRKNWALADNEARGAMSDATTKPRALVIIAQSYEKQGRFEEALQTLQGVQNEAQRTGTRVEQLDYTLGDIYANLERNTEAEQAFLREISTFPNNLQAYSSLSVLYTVSGRQNEVDPLLEKMFAANPNGQACLVAAETLQTLGDTAGAAKWRHRASSR
ncbi:MAG TPA: sulfatase-like hydrolase/transferase [Thermoanaerobaculia bacterium]|nr:sulfatase-like hydrolase/transferase [Thermoanaerobaculia bacterium]